MTSDQRPSTLSNLPEETNDKFISHPFPLKMHDMLQFCEDNGLEDIVSWQPDGTAFKVHKPSEFVKRILPKFFRQTKFKSFQRQLHLYSFDRIWEGPNKGGYQHKLFVRGCRNASRYLTRQTGFENTRLSRIASLLESLRSKHREEYRTRSQQEFTEAKGRNSSRVQLCRPKGFASSGLNLERIHAAATPDQQFTDSRDGSVGNPKSSFLSSHQTNNGCRSGLDGIFLRDNDPLTQAALESENSDSDDSSVSTFDREVGLVLNNFDDEDLRSLQAEKFLDQYFGGNGNEFTNPELD